LTRRSDPDRQQAGGQSFAAILQNMSMDRILGAWWRKARQLIDEMIAAEARHLAQRCAQEPDPRPEIQLDR